VWAGMPVQSAAHMHESVASNEIPVDSKLIPTVAGK